MIDDLDPFNTQEIVALTLIGESESLGQQGMIETACTLMNRKKANLKWMGGDDYRTICLQKGQYNCWDEGKDRERIISIGLNNPVYTPYVIALGIAENLLNDELIDCTHGAVSYCDGDAQVLVHPGSQPCYVNGSRRFYDLKSVA